MEGVTAIKGTETPSLLERIYSWENLLNAYHEAASEKWYRGDVLAFSAKLEENLIEIQNSLIWRTYKVGRYREFYVSEPKRRLIMALSFPDRVVQWAIYLQVNKELDNGMIYHSYGCRVGKGTTRAADRLQYWATLVDRKPETSWYYLKLDISKYFYRVDHEVLLGILRHKYPDEDGFSGLWRRSSTAITRPSGCRRERRPTRCRLRSDSLRSVCLLGTLPASCLRTSASMN